MKKAARHWCLYILRCRDGSFYTGVTVDLKKRLEKHNAGRGAKYTRGRRPLKLVYIESAPTERTARCREREIKSWRRKKKAALINGFTPKSTF
ncbi:MAG: GIY-YIG nuclease family protein [candidate division Zixibacteria bacterium]|nr:GIY-YIG nuclease family protein [candidate division Zixibacteria bacterium]